MGRTYAITYSIYSYCCLQTAGAAGTRGQGGDSYRSPRGAHRAAGRGGIPYTDGGQDAVRYINEEKGGIQGHKLRSLVIDHKMESAPALGGWDRIKSEGAPVVMAQTAAFALLWELPNRDKIPMVIGGGSGVEYLFPTERNYLFGVTPVLHKLYDSWVKVVADDWAASGGSGTPKLGFDVPSIGTAPKMLTKNINMLMADRGWEYITSRSSIAIADATTQVLQMKQLGCDYVYLYNSGNAIIAFVKEFDRQSFYPKITGSSAIASDEIWRALGDLAVGSTMPQFSVQWKETDIPGVKLLHELNAEWYPEVKHRPSHYCRGFTELLVVAEALDRAITKVGYENLNGDSMQEAMETIRDYDPMSMGIGYTWTPTDHQGLLGCRWYERAEDGTLTPITDWDILPTLPEDQRNDAFWLQD